jgi:hypothetical protein
MKLFKIAILGAPGAGKTKVARKVVQLLQDPEPKWIVVDGYVNQMIKQTGIQFGAKSNFPQNLSVITTRWTKEAEAYNKGLSSITCGSIYESILYSTFATMFRSPDEQQIVRDQLFNNVMMQALGAIEGTTYDYDAMFFIPLNPKVAKNAEGTWDKVIDAKLPEVLEAFQKKVILLDEKTDTAKAESIVEVIGKFHEFYTSLITTNDEQTV